MNEMNENEKSLSFQIMTLFEWNDFLQKKTYKCKNKIYNVKEFEEIILILKQFISDVKEPICFLYSQNKVLVCKSSPSLQINSIRIICIKEEIDSLKILNTVEPEWNTFIQKRADIDCEDVCFTEYIPLHSKYLNCRTMREFVDLKYTYIKSDVRFRSCLFQILATLIHLQKNFPGFRHNDLKTDNVVITQGSYWTIYELESKQGLRYFKVPTDVQCVLIDFESTAWKEKETSKNQELQTLKQAYGIYDVESNVFDFHLLCMDIIRTCRNEETNFEYDSFYLFLMDFFQEWCFKKENLIEYRLKRDHQLVMKWDLEEMILHPYFYGFRYLNNDTLDKKILSI